MANPYGFQLLKNGRLAMTPNFTPLCLVQVIDLPAGTGDIQTIVPVSKKFVAFHRSLDTIIDCIYWDQININGYWALRLNANRTAVRIYVFSDFLVNIPRYGFFVYRNGTEIVWHNNCLPLKVTPYGGTSLAAPVAISSGISMAYNVQTAAESIYGWRVFSAGPSSTEPGRYILTAQTLNQFFGSKGNEYPGNWSIPVKYYLDCTYYDAYYRQSLGY